MALADKTKTALDETRMLVLGAQILLGFQYRGAFEDRFAMLPAELRALDGLALVLMLVVLGLLIAPACWHRIVEGGACSGDFLARVRRFAGAALLPFALSLGLDIGIAVRQLAGGHAGLAAGIGFALLALAAWYGVSKAMRKGYGAAQRQQAAKEADKREDPPLHVKIDQMLTEARVILPGAQALLGFQLAIVLTESFAGLTLGLKLLHGVSLGCVALAIILLMTPPAWHRIVYAGEEAPEFLRFGSMLVATATLPLALGLAGDAALVFERITGSGLVAGGLAGLLLALLLGLWHVWPLLARRQRAGAAALSAT
jgi:hypothetical protein